MVYIYIKSSKTVGKYFVIWKNKLKETIIKQVLNDLV